jgi:hypothetical protein
MVSWPSAPWQMNNEAKSVLMFVTERLMLRTSLN